MLCGLCLSGVFLGLCERGLRALDGVALMEVLREGWSLCSFGWIGAEV